MHWWQKQLYYADVGKLVRFAVNVVNSMIVFAPDYSHKTSKLVDKAWRIGRRITSMNIQMISKAF